MLQLLSIFLSGLSIIVALISFSLRSSSHSFLRSYCSTGVLVVWYSWNSSPSFLLWRYLIVMVFSWAFSIFSSILRLFCISSSCSGSKSFMAQILLMNSFLSLCKKSINLRYSLTVLSMRKLEMMAEKSLALLQSISIMSSPIASYSFIQKSLFILSSSLQIFSMLLTMIASSMLLCQNSSTQQPKQLIVFYSFQEIKNFRLILDKIALISLKLRKAGNTNEILAISYSQKYSVIFWHQDIILLTSFSEFSKITILQNAYKRRQLLPTVIMSWVQQSTSQCDFDSFCQFSLLKTPKMGRSCGSGTKFVITPLSLERDCEDKMRLKDRSFGLFLNLLENLLGFRTQSKS